ncbi:uncharacterized protein LOC107607388 [Arachis ipaensis]|uniref:uncharacterized protein LOC107607388 n=1 Tax=Arachis ipaensis TaxID=130454 RepID=UPI0007AEE999|nr:uncharacterized protein LOC107607388 [Arachis ipaensis]
MAAMANLANTTEANAAATLQVVQRLGQPAENRNGNGKGNANDNAEGNGDNTGGVPMTLVMFLKIYPLTFRGSTNPTEVDNWFRAMERALQVQHVPINQYVEFAAYQLAGEAQPWWQAKCRLLQLQNADIPWEVFQTAFYKKYFPESAREGKEMELMQLKQGSMSVADYTNKFEELYRFSRVCQGAPEAYESWKCITYQRGLQDNIMTIVAPIEIRVFSDLVNKARVVEEYAKTVAASKDTHGGSSSRGRGKYFHPRGQSFKRGGYAPQSLGGIRKNTHDQIQRGKGRGNQSGCSNCGLPGHFARDCTREKNPSVGQSQHQGRVFAVNAKDASKGDPLMRGICLIGDKTLVALYDTGASHSFISFAKVEKLVLKVSELPFDLHVYTPHQTVMTRSECRQNRVLLDCFERSIRFMLDGENGAVVATGYYLNSVIVHCSGKECQSYILLVANALGDAQNLDQILVVRDFLEVFPEDIPEFPPQREIEFAIELVPGAGPVSIASYRMAPIELAELKTQVFRPFLDKFGVVFIDDILVYSKTAKEHEEHLSIMLQILKERKLYAKLSKCEFLKEEVKFLGHVVSKGGIAMDPSKVEAMMEWERPTTVMKVRSFLGLAGYYRRFIEGFSRIALPMTKLTRKETLFVWTSECEESFQTFKQRLTSAPANVVADALSQKSLTIAWMRIKEEELVDKFVDLKLGIGEVARRACLNQLQISSTFKSEIQRAQQDEQKLQQLFKAVGDKRRGELTRDGEGLWSKGRICIPDVGSLRQDLLSEAHNSGLSIHPRSTKMYYDLKRMFWWPGMKGDVATVVSKCLTCQKVKIEHQKPSGML